MHHHHHHIRFIVRSSPCKQEKSILDYQSGFNMLFYEIIDSDKTFPVTGSPAGAEDSQRESGDDV